MNSAGSASARRVDDAAEPGQLPLLAAVLVDPVRGDAVLGGLVHRVRAHLDLERLALRPDHRRVQRLVAVRLRHRDVVLEAARNRLPERVQHADRAVAVLDGVDQDAHRGEVEDLVELLAAARHLLVDRIEVLGAAEDLRADRDVAQRLVEDARGLLDVLLAIRAALADERLDLGVAARVQRREREVLELPLHLVDAQAMRDRRVHLERLARVLELLLLGQRPERAHVVQAVGELDDHDAHVARHRQHHLAVALGLRLLARVEVDARELGHAVDEQRDVVAELGGDLLERRLGVLDRVVQQRRDDHGRLGAQLGADARDAQRVHDVRLARLAHLVGVALGREGERALDGSRVGVVSRLLQRPRSTRRPGAGACSSSGTGCVREWTSELPSYRRRV